MAVEKAAVPKGIEEATAGLGLTGIVPVGVAKGCPDGAVSGTIEADVGMAGREMGGRGSAGSPRATLARFCW